MLTSGSCAAGYFPPGPGAGFTVSGGAGSGFTGCGFDSSWNVTTFLALCLAASDIDLVFWARIAL